MLCACNPGCGDRDETGPPTLHLGYDVCDFCKMIISDQNFAAACIVRSTDGRARSVAFDDIGCLLEFQESPADGTIEHAYVTDYDTGDWLNASDALYIQSPDIRSPMASGMIASQTPTGADRLADRFDASVMRFDELGTHTNQGGPGNHSEQAKPATQPINTEHPDPQAGT